MQGRLTLPVEHGIDDEIRVLMNRLNPDAIRNSDGTELPAIVHELAAKVYSTYFPARGDQEWANAHPAERIRLFLLSEAASPELDAEGLALPLEIDVLAGYLEEQFAVELECDTDKYWQVIDRSTGRTLNPSEYRIEPLPVAADNPEPEAARARVVIPQAQAGHRYTVSFLARQLWDSTQMYNYITNGWDDDPKRCKEKPYDVRYETTWDYAKSSLASWLQAHPEVDVVRFTTLFYHFTLAFNAQRKEKFVDWFGYSASVSIPALEEFEREYGYALTPEDFVDEGYYNSPFRLPRPRFRDWMDFQSRFVAQRAKELVSQVHAAGREAMMFLGDNWIGTEPYGPHFPEIGMDAVVGSVGSAATCRMISDIPGVRYTEGRFLPYFFPDVFRAGGDPIGEANASWLQARRAIVRSPLDRIGYGGYLSLALKFPEFIDRVEQIVAEFRQIHTETAGEKPRNAGYKVGVLNAWGKLRSWQCHMVAHALWYKQIYSYLGVLESLAGLPYEVEFLSFDEVARDGVPEQVGVLIVAGEADTAFSGGEAWQNVELQAAVRKFVARGGGFIGVGEPSWHPQGGVRLVLSDVLGVDRENGWSLSHDRYVRATAPEQLEESLRRLVSDLPRLDGAGISAAGQGPVFTDASLPSGGVDFVPGQIPGDVYATTATVLSLREGSVTLAANNYGRGRSIYMAGCAYSPTNSRLLHRAIHWAAGEKEELGANGFALDPRVEVAYYPGCSKLLAFNNSQSPVETKVLWDGRELEFSLAGGGYEWREL